MIVAYILITLLISWTWIDYFRTIDVFEKEKTHHLLMAFVLGAASVLVVYAIQHFILEPIGWNLTNHILNDFLYSWIGIGVVEEFAKTAPIVLLLYFLRDEVNEPIDYLIYFSLSALGFAAVENVFYMISSGHSVILPRAILATVGHMFDTALVAYGIILYRFKGKGWITVILFFIYGSLSHGFYDFWLIFKGFEGMGFLVTILYFLITISWFATILNNALNNSSFFTYKKFVNSNKLFFRLLMYYALIFAAQTILAGFEIGVIQAGHHFRVVLLSVGFIVVITLTRLTSFQLEQNKWRRLNLDIPVRVFMGAHIWSFGPRVKMEVDGDGFTEANVNRFHKDYFKISSVSSRRSFIGGSRIAFLEEKKYNNFNAIFYKIKVFNHTDPEKYVWMVLVPKIQGQNMYLEKYPIMMLLHSEDMSILEKEDVRSEEFNFLEFVSLEPFKSEG